MVPLFISLAWSLVVMAGGECLDTSMLQTQLLVYKRTPMLHPWGSEQLCHGALASQKKTAVPGILFVEK